MMIDTGIYTNYYVMSAKSQANQFPKFKKEMFDSIKEQGMLELWLDEYTDKSTPTVTSSAWYWTPQWRRLQ